MNRKQLETNYSSNSADSPVDYDLFPATNGARRLFVADDGCNSNSFNRGLLEAAGLEVPRPSVKVPGFDKPLPRSFFVSNKENQ